MFVSIDGVYSLNHDRCKSGFSGTGNTADGDHQAGRRGGVQEFGCLIVQQRVETGIKTK